MTAGRRDTLIELERAVVTSDDYNEEIADWVVIGREWAAVYYGRGDERRQAAVEQGQQAATFQVLANNLTRSMRIKDRITVERENPLPGEDPREPWDIVGISPSDRASLEFTAVRAS